MKMQKTMGSVVCLSVICLFIACRPPVTPTTPEQLGTDVFDAVRKNDLALLQKHIINHHDRENLMDSASVYNGNLEEVKNAIDYKISGWKQWDKTVLKNIREEGIQEGISWEQAAIGPITYKVIGGNGRYKTDIYVRFTSGPVSGSLKLDDCLQTDRGWVIYDDISLDEVIPAGR